MKKLLLGAGVVALLAAGNMAQAADQQIVIGASVATSCSVGPGATTATIGVSGGNVTTGDIEVGSYAVTCNTQATATLTSLNGGLSGPASASGFDNIIDYAANTTGAYVVPSASTATNPAVGSAEPLGSIQNTSATTGTVTVHVNPAANGQPLVAGSYSDTLKLEINPS